MKKNLLRLMCLFISIISICNVKALEESIELEATKYFFSGNTEFHMKKVVGDDKAFAFCLDSDKHFDSDVEYKLTNKIFNDERDKIEQVILKAFLKGLNTAGNDDNAYGLSNNEFYEVTQMAIWYAAHGDSIGGMVSDTYINWLNAKDKRKEAYNYLIGNDSVSVSKHDFSLETSGKELHLVVDGKNEYYESDTYTITSDLDTTIKIVESDKNNNACILYNGGCYLENVTISAGTSSFKLRIDAIDADSPRNSDGEFSVSASFSTSQEIGGYEFGIYDSGDDNVQNAVVFKPSYDWNNGLIIASTKTEVTTTSLEVSKVDATNQNELPGAHIQLYLDDAFVEEWDSTNTAHKIDSVQFNKVYKIQETVAPIGYIPVETSIYFMVNDAGKVITCDTDYYETHQKCNLISEDDLLKITNSPTQVIVSKRDSNTGEELSDAHFQILNENGEVVREWTSTLDPEKIIALPIGKYTLIETFTPNNYLQGMIIDGNNVTSYQFEVTGSEPISIVVYNEQMFVPITGVTSAGTYTIGAMIIVAGLATLIIVKRKYI